MPNKYEREIEEILRNLERTEPKGGFGQRVNRRVPRKPGVSRGFSLPRLSFPEWCLLIALVAALGAGGWAQATSHDTLFPGNLATGLIAVIGAICIGLVALSNFIHRPRYQAPNRYNNVTQLRGGNPWRRLTTRWHLLMLKLRYRSRGPRQEE
ncbi:MAG TPA: hypothetical protein VF458_03375 [Ktedonobacteraceae bacterium]